MGRPIFPRATTAMFIVRGYPLECREGPRTGANRRGASLAVSGNLALTWKDRGPHPPAPSPNIGRGGAYMARGRKRRSGRLIRRRGPLIAIEFFAKSSREPGLVDCFRRLNSGRRVIH